MPRYINRKSRKTPREKAVRARKYTVRGFKGFVDPFPHVHGTLPEKMVYAALSYRGIEFLFLNDIKFEIPEIEFLKVYQADFVIPSLRLIIEVQGAFWHSKPEAIESDAFKFAVYQQTGWRVLAWWDFDIIENVNKLFAEDSQLRSYNVTRNYSAELPVQSRLKQNTSKGIVTMNQRRGQRLMYRKKAVSVKTRKRKTAGSNPVFNR